MSIIIYGFIRARRTGRKMSYALSVKPSPAAAPCLYRSLQWSLSAALQRGSPLLPACESCNQGCRDKERLRPLYLRDLNQDVFISKEIGDFPVSLFDKSITSAQP